MRETWVQSWVGKIPWRREWLPTPVFLPGEFHGQYSPWGCKESDTTEVRGGGWEELPHAPMPEARGGGREDQPQVQGAVAVRAQEGLEELSHVEGQEGQR